VEARVDGSTNPCIGVGWLCLLALLLIAPACSPPETERNSGAREDEAMEDIVQPPPSSRWEGIDLTPHFAGVEGTFVLLDDATGESLVYDSERAATPFLPASTFKIPHTLIALKSGVADGPNFTLDWDPDAVPAEPWWPDAWARDQTLTQAFSGSVVWFYQEMARRVGPARMEEGLSLLQYGNGDLSAGVDRFWLEGGFALSAEDQVRFLRRMLRGEFELSEDTVAAVKELLLIEEEPGHRLSGKTGWVGFGSPSAPQLGWFVGYLESSQGTFLFALNLDIRSPEDAGRRIRITREILAALELL
jgi:beta-lactamase class D